MATTTTSATYENILRQLLPPQTPAPVLPPPSAEHDQKPRPHHPDLTAAIASLQLHPTLETLLHILNADLAGAHFLVRHMQSPPAWEGMALHALLHRYEGHISNARAWYTDIAGCAVLDFVWVADEEVANLSPYSTGLQNAARDAIANEMRTKEEAGRTDKDTEAKHSAQNHADDADASAPGTSAAQEASKALPYATKFLERVEKLQGAANAPHRFGGGADAFEKELKALSWRSEAECRFLLAWCEAKYGTKKWEDASGEYVGMSEKIADIATKQVMGGEGWRQF